MVKEEKVIGEIVQFKIIEKEVVVEVPKYVEKEVIVPKFVEKVYEVPVYKTVTYEKPVITTKDITSELKLMIMSEVEKAIASVIQNLKFQFEIPAARILQVRPGSGKVE